MGSNTRFGLKRVVEKKIKKEREFVDSNTYIFDAARFRISLGST